MMTMQVCGGGDGDADGGGGGDAGSDINSDRGSGRDSDDGLFGFQGSSYTSPSTRMPSTQHFFSGTQTTSHTRRHTNTHTQTMSHQS